MVDELDGQPNVVVVSFQDDSNAYEALTTLKQLDSQRQIELSAAAVVARGEDGRVEVKDEVGDAGVEGTATGGVVGLLIENHRRTVGDPHRRSDRSAGRLPVRHGRRRRHRIGSQ